MPVAVLGLHDLGAVYGCLGHGGHVGRALERVGVVGICEAVGPHLVNEGGFRGVRRGLHDVRVAEGLFGFVVGFAASEEGPFGGVGESEKSDVDGLFGDGIQGYHGEGAGHEDFVGLDGVAFLRSLSNLKSYLHTASSRSVGHLTT